MRVVSFFTATLVCVSAFAPCSVSRSKTELHGFMDNVFGMDLFEPVKHQNEFGARSKKNLGPANIGTGSYVPDGLSLAEYRDLRAKEAKYAEAKYNAKKSVAGKILEFTKFYKERGTDENGSWMNMPNRGHRMVKLKYEYDAKDFKKYDGKV